MTFGMKTKAGIAHGRLVAQEIHEHGDRSKETHLPLLEGPLAVPAGDSCLPDSKVAVRGSVRGLRIHGQRPHRFQQVPGGGDPVNNTPIPRR